MFLAKRFCNSIMAKTFSKDDLVGDISCCATLIAKIFAKELFGGRPAGAGPGWLPDGAGRPDARHRQVGPHAPRVARVVEDLERRRGGAGEEARRCR